MTDHAHIEYILKREHSKLEEECDELRAELARSKAKSEERKMTIDFIIKFVSFGWCPICDLRNGKHKNDCAVGKALED